MDDIQKVIDFINDEIAWLTEQKDSTDTIMGEVYKEIDGDERIQIMRNAISAMQSWNSTGSLEHLHNAAQS